MKEYKYRVTPRFNTYQSKGGNIDDYRLELLQRGLVRLTCVENYYRKTKEEITQLIKEMREEGYTLTELK